MSYILFCIMLALNIKESTMSLYNIWYNQNNHSATSQMLALTAVPLRQIFVEALHRTNSNVVFAFFWLQPGANKIILFHVSTSYTNDIGYYTKRNVSANHKFAWSHWFPNYEPSLTGGNPPLKYLRFSIFMEKDSQKRYYHLF